MSESLFNGSDDRVQYLIQANASKQLVYISNGTDAAASTDMSNAFLVDSCTMSTARNSGKKYFLNTQGIALILGKESGTVQLNGLLGDVTSFRARFGDDPANPCKLLKTVKMSVGTLAQCIEGSGALNPSKTGFIIARDCVVSQVQIGSTYDQQGTLYYTASVALTTSGLKFSDN